MMETETWVESTNIILHDVRPKPRHIKQGH